MVLRQHNDLPVEHTLPRRGRQLGPVCSSRWASFHVSLYKYNTADARSLPASCAAMPLQGRTWLTSSAAFLIPGIALCR